MKAFLNKPVSVKWLIGIVLVAVVIGAAGSTGPAGPAGPARPKGPVGLAGIDGQDGQDGERGPRGSRGSNGKDAPQPEVASAGTGDGGSVIGDGTWEVGADVQPGQYRANGGGSCYFQTSSDANGADILDNSYGEKNVVVTLESGQWFNTESCGDWS
jgi:hypothetical protein